MPRAATGRIESTTWKDGKTATWRLRVRDRGRRHAYEWRLGLVLGFDPHRQTAGIDAAWVNDLRGHLANRPNRNGKPGTLSPRSVNMALDFEPEAHVICASSPG